MRQADLNRAVALATGESMSTVKRLGFLLAEPEEVIDPEAEESGPYIIDWDELQTSECCRTVPKILSVRSKSQSVLLQTLHAGRIKGRRGVKSNTRRRKRRRKRRLLT